MFTGVMKKLIEWIMYSLDIEMAQKLPIAVSCNISLYLATGIVGSVKS